MYYVVVANTPELDVAPYQEQLRAADLVIAADGGARALLQAGVLPQVVLGDLDSLDAASERVLQEHGVELQRFPRAKDETDLELALIYAAAHGATRIDILGALGGRWDHTLANVAMLAHPALVNCIVRMLADRQTLFVVRGTADIHGQHGDTVSLVPLTPLVHGVTTAGLLYPLHHATLRWEQARGVSNVLLESPGCVTVEEGLLLIVQHDDNGAYQWRGGDEATR